MNSQYRSFQTLRFMLISAAFLMFTSVLHGQTNTPDTSIELVSEVTSVAEGETFSIALHLEPKEGWHIYWINGGDAGYPPRMPKGSEGWVHPENFTIGDFQFEAPHFVPLQTQMQYGYKDSTLFIADVDAPESFDGDVTISAKVEWLACDDSTCVPEDGEVSITLPKGNGTVDREWQVRFNQSRSLHPIAVDWVSTFTSTETEVVLDVEIPEASALVHDVWFFPEVEKLIDHAAEQTIRVSDEGRIRIETVAGLWYDKYDEIYALLQTVPDAENRSQSFRIHITRANTLPDVKFSSSKARIPLNFGGEEPSALQAFLNAFMFAFLGGLVLNVMPCVLPILSLKALSVAELTGSDAKAAHIAGWAYTAGVLLCFQILAVALILLRATGLELGWGFQLQDPIIVALLALLVVVVGFNFSGLFEIRGSFANLGGLTTKLTNMRGTGDFFTGLLAVLIASPCTVPGMSLAAGYALAQPWPLLLTIFLGLGIGFALPYLLVTLAPPIRKLLPKPGAWMETFRKLLAFPLYGTAIWLVYVLGSQAGNMAVVTFLSIALITAFALWSWTKGRASSKMSWHVVSGLGTAGIVAIFIWLPPAPTSATSLVPEFEWSVEEVERRHEEGKPIFAYFTADWCVTCKINEQFALKTNRVQRHFEENEFIVFVGDWTSYDADIKRELEKHDRAGVPLYLYYEPGGNINEPTVLPAVLTARGVVRRTALE
ncbi:MAG: protein-disulfide reductase DsbD family protein [Gammaproteobacteria bacterium]|nr:protein-disulfide reductase DsbD family protein [Gammaproteobacteria bacterium]